MILKGVNNIGDPTISEVIRDNIITFLDYGFTSHGGYTNVNIPQSGLYGGYFHILKPVDHPNYTDGTVWESPRKNWVWENDLEIGTPIQISGLFINNTYYPNGSGYYIDYRNGRVVFDSAKALSSTITIAHSEKWVAVVNASDHSIFRRVQSLSYRPEDYVPGSGYNTELTENRLQLPCIAVQVMSDRSYEGAELGHARWAKTDVIFYILAEDDSTVSKIADIVAHQDEKTLNLFDPKKIAEANAFPLDYRGSIASGNMTYPNLILPSGSGGYMYTSVNNGKFRFYNTHASRGSWLTDNIYQATVKTTTEIMI